MEIDKLLEACIKHDGSDLHIRVGVPPKLRIESRLSSLGKQVLTPEDTASLARSITSEKHMQELEELGTTDFGFSFTGGQRFRVSVFKHQGHIGIVMRLIPSKLYTFEALGLPSIVKELCLRPRGLFLVTGPTGSGKTTTLATMIDFINKNRHDHIVTVEDPIEYVHGHKKCVVTQREIGADVISFSEALRRGLRQDPDIFLVGELRDLDTIAAAITAAETGHLVFATLHTTGAAPTITRIVDVFPTNQQEQIRIQLSANIVAVLSQQLLVKKGGGRIAAFELMISNPAIQHLIRKNETFKIDSIIQTGSEDGMILLDDHLFHLFSTGKIAYTDAIGRSKYPDAIDKKIREFRAQMEQNR
ncbi:MAG: type IV pilus twitching motility protein PilT [Planctomycetes bacterium]|nr:type IV pilus twitching motility protein PilT [Planctomycetota bacterium]